MKRDANKTKQKLNEFHKKFTSKVGDLNEATSRINNFLLQKAKSAKEMEDVAKLSKNEAKLEILAEDFAELGKEKLEMSKDDNNLFMKIVNQLLGAVLNNPYTTAFLALTGLGGGAGAIKHVKQSKQLGRVKRKWKKSAKSTEVDDIEDDDDLVT